MPPHLYGWESVLHVVFRKSLSTGLGNLPLAFQASCGCSLIAAGLNEGIYVFLAKSGVTRYVNSGKFSFLHQFVRSCTPDVELFNYFINCQKCSLHDWYSFSYLPSGSEPALERVGLAIALSSPCFRAAAIRLQAVLLGIPSVSATVSWTGKWFLNASM